MNPRLWQTAFHAYSLIEVLVVTGIVGLLFAITVPGVTAARHASARSVCAAHMRSLGQAMFCYSAAQDDVLPFNGRTWQEATWQTHFVYGGPDGNVGWMGAIGRQLFSGPPWLRALRCPRAPDADATNRELGYPAPQALRSGSWPGSCWLLNAYCSARKLSSIPNPSDGALLLELGVWNAASWDTGSLEYSYQSWCYPHPLGFVKKTTVPWDWLGPTVRNQRNYLWCDGHVAFERAARWPHGDVADDPQRIQHMRFGLPPTNAYDN